MTDRAPGKSELIAQLRQRLELSEAEIGRLTNGPFEASETVRAALGGRDIPAVQEALNALLPQLRPRSRMQLEPTVAGATASLAAQKVPPPPGLEGRGEINLLKERPYERWFIPDQRPRQTCVAYAAAACIELLWAKRGADFEPLSAQFLYWYMRTTAPKSDRDRPPGWAEGATRLSYAKAVLEKYGICREAVCRSGLEPDLPLEGREPSNEAQKEAAKYRLTSDHQDFRCAKRPAGIAYGVYELLAAGRPVAIALPEFPRSPGSTITNWNNPTSWGSGIVADPPPDLVAHDPEDPTGPGHAVCIVGFQQDRDRTGGWFLFRNSLGGDWANSVNLTRPHPPQVPAPGYGAISADHIERYCWEMLCPELS